MKNSASGRTTWRAALAAALGLVAVTSHAGFQQGSPSASAQALGGAFTAKADDSSAIFINPSGLSQLGFGEASLMYSRPLAGLSGVSLQQGALSAAVPLGPDWTVGAGAWTFDASGLLSEKEAILGAAYKPSPRWAVGASASYLSHSYSVSGDALASRDPVFSGATSKAGVGLGVGAMFFPRENLSLGLSGRNLNRPNLGLASKDIVPMEVRTGGMLKLSRFSVLADIGVRDAGSDVADGRQVNWALGGEWQALQATREQPSLVLRLGLNAEQIGGGFGLNLGFMRVDYAFSLMESMLSDSFGGHRLSLSFRFGSGRDADSVKPRAAAMPRREAPAANDPFDYYQRAGSIR